MHESSSILLFIGNEHISLGCTNGSNTYSFIYDTEAEDFRGGVGLQENGWYWRDSEESPIPDNAGMQIFIGADCGVHLAPSMDARALRPDARLLLHVFGQLAADGSCDLTIERLQEAGLCVAGSGMKQCCGPCSLFPDSRFCCTAADAFATTCLESQTSADASTPEGQPSQHVDMTIAAVDAKNRSVNSVPEKCPILPAKEESFITDDCGNVASGQSCLVTCNTDDGWHGSPARFTCSWNTSLALVPEHDWPACTKTSHFSVALWTGIVGTIVAVLSILAIIFCPGGVRDCMRTQRQGLDSAGGVSGSRDANSRSFDIESSLASSTAAAAESARAESRVTRSLTTEEDGEDAGDLHDGCEVLHADESMTKSLGSLVECRV